MDQILSGQVAMVTGAGSQHGIGRAIALGLVRTGARVALLDLNEATLARNVEEARAIGGEACAIGIVTDVTEPEALENAVRRTIEELGGLHVIINNAATTPAVEELDTPGSSGMANTWEVSPRAWDRVVAVNLNGSFYLIRAAMSHLLAQGWGRIIGVTTSLDTMYRSQGSPYGPTKAAHEAMMAALAQELGGTGVTANILVPGGVTDTDMVRISLAGRGYTPADMIQPQAMVAPCIWLASSESEGFNNQRIVACRWDEALPLPARLAKAAAPAAWQQLGGQAIWPSTRK